MRLARRRRVPVNWERADLPGGIIMADPEEPQVKIERVREYMAGHRFSAVLLTRQNNFAWFTCGGDNHVVTASDMGAATLVITTKKVCVVTANIEAGRIAEEETRGLEIEVLAHPWQDEARKLEMIAQLMGLHAASDDGVAGTKLLAPDFAELRFSLTPQEVERYRALGRDCGEVIGKAAAGINPGETELQVAGRLSRGCLERNIVPSVTLVAADERVRKYRHPIAKANRIEKCAEIVLCGRRHGLVCSVTRLVHFGRAPGAGRTGRQAPGRGLGGRGVQRADRGGRVCGRHLQGRSGGVRRSRRFEGVGTASSGRTDRVCRARVPGHCKREAHGPAEPGLRLESEHHGHQVGGHDPGRQGRAGGAHRFAGLAHGGGGMAGQKDAPAGYSAEMTRR